MNYSPCRRQTHEGPPSDSTKRVHPRSEKKLKVVY
jgi:hypothetical protein